MKCVNSTALVCFTEASATDMVVPRITSYIAFVLFTLMAIGVVVGCAAFRYARIKIVWPIPLRYLTTALHILILAMCWLFAGSNGLLWHSGSVARVALNTWAWYNTLAGLGKFYELREPVLTEYLYVCKCCLGFMALAVFGTGGGRFISVLAVVPLGLAVLLAASLWAGTPQKAIVTFAGGSGTGAAPLSYPRSIQEMVLPHIIVLVLVVLVGLLTLIFEMLSQEYGGVVPLSVSFGLMLAVHIALTLIWLACVVFHGSGHDTHKNGNEDPAGKGSPLGQYEPEALAVHDTGDGHTPSSALMDM